MRSGLKASRPLPLRPAVLLLVFSVGVPALSQGLASLPVFRVSDVRVEGARYLDVRWVEAAGGWLGRPLLGDFSGSLFRVAAHPLVQRVDLARRLPAGLIVRIREVEPAALWEDRPGHQVVVSRDGHPLPIPPSAVLDLPLIRDAVGVEGSPGALLRELSNAQAVLGEVAELTRKAEGLHLRLREVEGTVLLPIGSERWLLVAAARVIEDLKARGERLRLLDLRYRHQAVLLPGGKGAARPARMAAAGKGGESG